MHQSKTGTQQEVHQKYNPKEQLRFALIIGMDRCSLICGKKHIKQTSNTSYNIVGGVSHIPVANGCVLLINYPCNVSSLQPKPQSHSSAYKFN